jgi:hypothetical protein
LKVFVSYAHKDSEACADLIAQLSPLRREKIIEVWSDHQILPGTNWRNVISQELEEADIILLAVTANFIDSDFCYCTEMIRALARHTEGRAQVIPISLKACYWDLAPFAEISGLPRDMKAILSRPVHERDEIYTEVVRGIHQTVKEAHQRKSSTHHRPAPRNSLESNPPLGFGKKNKSTRCIGRDQIIESLIYGCLTENAFFRVIMGPLGIGKTMVASTVLHDSRIANHFRKRCFFVRCDSAKVGSDLIERIALTVDVAIGENIESRVIDILSRSPSLMILDNISLTQSLNTAGTEETLAKLRRIPRLSLILTLRQSHQGTNALLREVILLGPLERHFAQRLLVRMGGPEIMQDPLADRALRRTKGNPRLIELLARTYRAGAGLEKILNCQGLNKGSSKELSREKADNGAVVTEDVSSILSLLIADGHVSSDGVRLLALLGVLPDGIAHKDLHSLLPDGADRSAAQLRRHKLIYDQLDRLYADTSVSSYARKELPLEKGDLDLAINHYFRHISSQDKITFTKQVLRNNYFSREVNNMENILNYCDDRKNVMITSELKPGRLVDFGDGFNCSETSETQPGEERAQQVNLNTNDKLSSESEINKKNIISLYSEGKLTERVVEVFLLEGDRTSVILSLSFLASIPVPVIHRIISTKSPRAITSLVWRAGLPMRFALLVQLHLAQIPPKLALRPRDGVAYPMTEDEMIWQIEFFGIKPRD